MASNFDFLTKNWNFLLEDAQRVEAFALSDPRTAAFYARRTLERALQWLYANDSALKTPYEKSLAAMIHEPTFKNNVKQGLFQDIRFIHKLGNLAVHDDQDISSQNGMQACGAIFRFTGWLARVYTRGSAVPGQFNIQLLPKADDSSHQASVVELQNVRDQLAQKEQAEAEAKAKQQQTDEELAQLKEQLALLQAIKQENQQKIPADDYTEAQTRDAFIDVMLREASWDPKDENVEEYEVTGMPTASGERTGTGYVDYVLWGADNLPLAVVEAKKTKVDPKVGKRQAELYADCLEQAFSQRPVIFYTNGYNTWCWDDIDYPPRTVEGFYTRDELQWLINRRASKQNLTLLQPDTAITGRAYQMEAAARVMDTFETQRKRKALVVMATGTGKTRLSIALVDMLMTANWARKILFLADRVALVNQAKREFNRHLPHISVASLLDKKQDDARVIFSTYPTMLNCIDGTKKDQKEIFSVAHFDLVIIDEAHRSVYQKYGAIFDYFDSLLLGLTATPRGEVDRNTYRLFELADHQPTFSYELEQAVEDGFLVPPRAISVPLKFQREGIKYNELSSEEQEEYELQEQFYDDTTGELKEEIGAAALNQWLFNTDTVNKVLMHLMENGIKVEGGDKLGKTIIFAKNRRHAEFIVEQFDKNYPHLAGKFCRKIDYSVKYAQSLIDDFSIKNKDPYISVSVDMLDTGIDVPEVVNLVFFKLVRSKTKFWQMLGRGTRLCEDLFAAGEDKKEFIVFDYCQNLDFFDANPDGYDSKPQKPLKQRVFEHRLELAMALQDGNPEDESLAQLAVDLKDQMHREVNSMNLDNFIVRKQRKEVETFSERDRWQNLSIEDSLVLANKLSGLPSQDDDDEFSRRFDLLILKLQLATLQKSSLQETYQLNIREIAKGLEDKSTIPSVKLQMELILEVQTDSWWLDVTLPMLEDLRLRLRDLIRFIDPGEGLQNVYTDFEDEIGEDAIEYPVVKPDPVLRDYRRRVQRFIHDHEDHITIRRLKNNEPISETDIKALEDILFAEDGPIPREEYEKIYGETPLGLLVRSVVGLDRMAAKDAFAEFLGKATLHPDQIVFLDEVVNYIVKNGTMEPKILFTDPFNRYHDLGIKGVLGDDQSREVIELIRKVNNNAGIG